MPKLMGLLSKNANVIPLRVSEASTLAFGDPLVSGSYALVFFFFTKSPMRVLMMIKVTSIAVTRSGVLLLAQVVYYLHHGFANSIGLLGRTCL